MTARSPLKTHLWVSASEIAQERGKVCGNDRELIFGHVAMRYQWDVQMEFAFGFECVDQKRGRTIWEKNFGLTRT